MSPVQTGGLVVPGASLDHQVEEPGPLVMISGTPADAGWVALVTRRVAHRTMGVAWVVRRHLKT